MITELTRDNFQTQAVQAEETVLIDFWATWCGPCRMLAPVIDEIAREDHPGLKVCKVNVDEQPELAQKFNVMSIPTLVVMSGGKTVASSMGVQPKNAILQMLGL